ncbi:hypothetical protein EST38_g6777 [Candolleomyces aberdarensis]|uniref:Uncharacterized protein n=1 Tax=Candolleomyces aberdarensis TaxID=2316362 RepID=A0A4Q2DHB1_9AGAR|nr:hypothetical protein EST38_g6777 [Candolleomyces aberdarensis]
MPFTHESTVDEPQLPGIPGSEPVRVLSHINTDPLFGYLQPGKRPVDLIIDFLTRLWEYTMDQITRDTGAVAAFDTAESWLTVPAAWVVKGCKNLLASTSKTHAILSSD